LKATPAPRYLRICEGVGAARNSIGRSFDFYNCRRPHQNLDDAPHRIKPASARAGWVELPSWLAG